MDNWKKCEIEDRKDDLYGAVESANECRPEPDGDQLWRGVTSASKCRQWLVTLRRRSVPLMTIHCKNTEQNTYI